MDEYEITDTQRMDLLERLFPTRLKFITVSSFVDADRAVVEPTWRAWCDAVIWAEAFDAVAEACQ